MAKGQGLLHAAGATGEGGVKGASKRMPRLTFPPTGRPEHRAGPQARSARSACDGMVAPLAPDRRGEL